MSFIDSLQDRRGEVAHAISALPIFTYFKLADNANAGWRSRIIMSKLRQKLNLTLCLGMGLGMTLSAYRACAAAPEAQAMPAEIQFDTNVLTARGYSADVAKFFAREARFLPGTQLVSIAVNADAGKQRDVRFDSEGNVCFDRTLLSQLTLRIPDGLQDGSCANVEQLFPSMRVELQPGLSRVNVLVPDDAFDPAMRQGASLRGGRAALLNYRLFAQQFQGNGSKQNYFQAQLNPGLNIDNWAFRSFGVYTHDTYRSEYQQQDAYAQRNVESMNALLQFGAVSTASDVYGGMPMTGLQLFSDSAQQNAVTLAVPIQGIAATNAVIELRQRGQVVYRTVVSPGPYSLSEVGAISPGADIEVQVTEEDGHVSRYSVPAPMTAGGMDQPATYHMGLGRYRDVWGGTMGVRTPWLAYGDYAFNLSPRLRLSNGALLAQGYQGASTQATLAADSGAWVGTGLRVSRADDYGSGYEWQLQGSTPLGRNFSGGLSLQSRSRGFAPLDQAVFRYGQGEYPSSFMQSFNASLSWASTRWGAFSYGVSRTRDWGGSATSHTLTAGRKVGPVNANLTVQKSNQGSTAAYLSLSMPLGQDSISTRFYHTANNTNTFAANYQGRPRSDLNYQLDAAKTGDSTRLSASGQARTAYAQVSAGVSQTGAGSRSFYGSASGGVVVTDDRSLATSSSQVGDTFAVVKVPLSGLDISGAGGNAKTSALGTALIPHISPYRKTQIKVDGKTLPLNYRLDTSTLDMNLARGTVAMQSIGATEMRQLMLQVRMPDNSFAIVGTSVLDEEGNFMGTVVGEGNVVLTNADIGKPIYLAPSGQSRCKVQYDTPEKFNPESPYEEAPATCVIGATPSTA